MLRRKGKGDQLLFERGTTVYPPPPDDSSTAHSTISSSSAQAGSSSTSIEVAPSTSFHGGPSFGGSRHTFSIPIPSTLPQCLHQPSLSLSYTLSASLTLRSTSAGPSTSTVRPTVVTESMEIHLCPSGLPSSESSPLIRTLPAPGRTPTPVLVGYPKTRCRKSEQIRLWVEIPIPDQRDLEKGVGLRNVRAELWRVVTIASLLRASSSTSDDKRASRGSIPPSQVALSPVESLGGYSSSATLLTTTGSSCRFSPLSPIRLRLSVHAPLSPSSSYQLTCGHLTQRVLTGDELVEVKFWVKVMIGFVGSGVEEVDCEQEVVVLGDLDEPEQDLLVEAEQSEEEEGAADVETPVGASLELEDRPFTKEKIFEGETYRQSDDVGPSASGSSYGLPPGFVEALPSFSDQALDDPSSQDMSVSHDPPPFSEFPASGPSTAQAFDDDEPPSPGGGSSRPPPFTPVAVALADAARPPPTFFEAVPESDPHSSASTSPASPPATAGPSSAPLVPFLHLPLQVAPPTSPSADPANLPSEWLEVDGYETFSLPPPPVSVGLETTGSVDPPAEGEGAVVDRSRLERIYDSISPANNTTSTISSPERPLPASGRGRGTSMSRDGSRVDDPNDLPPTFRDLAISSVPLGLAHPDDHLPPHPSEIRSTAGSVVRGDGTEVVPPPYAGDVGSGGVLREGDAEETGEQPPRYS